MKKLNRIKITEITVDTIDFIEKQVHKVTQENSEKELLINKVIKMLNDHYSFSYMSIIISLYSL